MNKKALASFAGIFLFLYVLNYLTPMCFGDDYLYSFVWQGQPMFVPLGEEVPRVSSWYDLFVSQKSHYLTWGGRTVAHVLAQLFLWIGKDVFNFLNAFIGTLLVAEIYWCINRGRVTWHFKPGTVCWIFFVLWAFTTGFSTVFFWLTAACNYLWTTAILIGFMIPYIKRYYYFDSGTDNNSLSTIGMFIFGIVAGWTNENSVCWVILLLILFIFVYCKKQKNNNWMYAGLIGLIIGYAMFSGFHLGGKYKDELLILSPVAVKTELQRQHISKEIIEYGFEKAKSMGFSAVIVEGNPQNYRSRGFKTSADFGITADESVGLPAIECMMVRELKEGALEHIKGVVKYTDYKCLC